MRYDHYKKPYKITFDQGGTILDVYVSAEDADGVQISAYESVNDDKEALALFMISLMYLGFKR